MLFTIAEFSGDVKVSYVDEKKPLGAFERGAERSTRILLGGILNL